ncbi:MAG: cation:proton antiporter [Candidatus Aphodosoma sp.]|nr:cation:proton antiporter [Candidatus Aphodosoma sp.]
MNETLVTLPLTDPIEIFLIVLMIILCAPILNKIRIPHIIGLILAGMILGPYGFNVLDYDKSFELFGKVGILYIMFQAGLEIDLVTFKQNKTSGILFGIYTFLIPMIMGTLGNKYILNLNWTESILIASMYASHTLIAYPIVSRMGIIKNRSISITIAGTIITVAASLIVLAIVIASTKGTMNAEYWIKFCIKTIFFSIIVFLLLPRISKYFLQKLNTGTSQYIFVLTIIFIASLCAQFAGLEGILGAFFAGLILNRLIPSVSPLMNRIEFVGNAIFIPFFLIGIGMIINIRAFVTDFHAIFVAVVMTIIAIVTKWLPAKLTQITSHLNKNEGNLIFGLSSAQAAATLAAAMIGYQIGLINSEVLNGTVIMILLTCTISSVVTEHASRKIAISESKRDLNRQKVGIPKVLIPISNPQTMPLLIDISNLIKPKEEKKSLFALQIHQNNYTESSAKLMDQAIKIASATENIMEPIVKSDFNVANCIVETANEKEITDIVIGIHQKANIVDTFLGSKTTALINSTFNQNLIISSTKKPLNTLHRIVTAVPKNAENEIGFEIWFDRIFNICTQLNIKALFFCNEETKKTIKQLCENYEFSNVEFKELSSWEDFLIITKEVNKHDGLAIITARKSTISYNSLFDKIPHYLNKYFTETNFLLIYPRQDIKEDLNTEKYNPLKIS